MQRKRFLIDPGFAFGLLVALAVDGNLRLLLIHLPYLLVMGLAAVLLVHGGQRDGTASAEPIGAADRAAP